MSLLRKRNSFEEKLREQLGETEWKPSESLWDRIEKNIDADAFEPALQKKLEDFRVEPREEVWHGVESNLPEQGNRRGAIWLTAGIVALLMTFISGYWFGAFGPNELDREVVLVQTKPDVQKPSEVPLVTGAETKQKEGFPSVSKPRLNRGGAETESGSHTLLDEIPSRQEVMVESKVKEVRKVNLSSKSKGVISGISKNALKPEEEIQKNNVPVSPLALGKEIIPPARESGSKENDPSLPKPDQVSVSGSPIPKSDTSKNSTASNTGNSENPDRTGSDNPGNVSEIPSSLVTDTTGQITGKPYNSSSYLAPDEEFTNFSITVQAGIHNSYMWLAKPAGSDYGDLGKSLDLRKDIETPALDFSGGIQLDYHFAKNWWVSTGIGMTSLRQNVNFNHVPVSGTAPKLAYPPGSYLYPSDTITSGTTNKYENKYAFTEIPVYIGYQFPSESRLHFSLSGGFSYARLNLINAYMPDPSCVGVLEVKDAESFPEFRDQIFVTFQPAASWNINSAVELGASFYAKAGLNDFVKNTSWISQRPALAGISLFLRKRL